ncbi:unnamed protein product [Echinostoma caproni]|uniref:Protein kinase domain-containing protein n=1 Tax=Echinostoma caproni TaxID=27848 RepID=A0A183AUR6_9TREM|nr:unnamed protein product [Echinostoma caproni]
MPLSSFSCLLAPLVMARNTVGHEALANEVRQSPYFQQLPALPVSCRELDGDTSSLPIIFEDVFLSPNSHDPKRVPWYHQSISPKVNGVNSDDSPCEQTGPPARGDSQQQVNGKIPQVLVQQPDNDSLRVSAVARPSLKLNPHLRYDMPAPLTAHSRMISSSTPALPGSESTRATATLPPVLRYLGQNRRKFRRSNSHGQRSLQTARSKHRMSALPDPVHHGSVRLLGFRSVGTEVDESFVDSRPHPRPTSLYLGNHQDSKMMDHHAVRLRPKHMSLKTREFDGKRLRSSSMEQLDTVKTDRSFSVHDVSLSRSSCVLPSQNHTSEIQPTTLEDGLIVPPMLRSSSLTTAPKLQIAIGTLSRAPREPPGGCIPPAHLTSELDLFPTLHDGGAANTDVESSMHAFLRSRTLSSLSVPDLAYACAMARVKSESALVVRGTERTKGRSKSAMCRVYTSDLACLGSYSELDLTILEDASNERRISQPYDSIRSQASTKPLYHRMSRSTSNLCPSELNAVVSRPPLLVNGVRKANTLTSSERTSIFGRPAAVGSPELHRRHGDSRLRECGYQLRSDVDEDTDEEMTGDTKSSRVRQDEKLSILELLREDGRILSRQTYSHHNLSTLNGLRKSGSGKYRTLDSVPRRQNTLSSHRSYAVLHEESDLKPLVDVISPGVVEFLQLKENVKRQIAVDFQGHVYSDFATVAAPYAYFSDPPMQNDELHLVVCVHGLDGEFFSICAFGIDGSTVSYPPPFGGCGR